MQKYSQSVRPEAAYLPDNVPFVAEINGLEGGAEAVQDIVFAASYMVCHYCYCVILWPWLCLAWWLASRPCESSSFRL